SRGAGPVRGLDVESAWALRFAHSGSVPLCDVFGGEGEVGHEAFDERAQESNGRCWQWNIYGDYAGRDSFPSRRAIDASADTRRGDTSRRVPRADGDAGQLLRHD